MIRIAISQTAFEAIARPPPMLGRLSEFSGQFAPIERPRSLPSGWRHRLA
jgi:hypothetical protein